MDIKIYYAPESCPFMAHALLEELNFSYESVLINVREGENMKESFLKKNPHGKIPLLEVDGEYIAESLAILTYLADLKPERKLLPSTGTIERAQVLQQASYFSASVHPIFVRFFRPNRIVEEPTAYKTVQKTADTQLSAIFSDIDKQLANSEFFLTDISILDFQFFVYGRWGNLLSKPTKEYPNLNKFMENFSQRPSIQKTLQKENIGLYRMHAPKIT